MSEALINAPFAVEATPAAHEITIRWKQATALAAGILLTAACSGGSEARLTPPTTGTTTSAELTAASRACGETIDTSANSANKNYGSPESIFPSLNKKADKSGQESLLATDKASVAIREQLTHDNRALGIFSAYFLETRKTQQLPSTGTLGRANELIKAYGTNPALTEQALTDACNSLAFLKPETKFAVTRGQAMAVETVRGADGNITGFKTETINATENLSGFILDFNRDAKNTDVQKAIYDKLSKLILITADGKVVVNQTFGPSSFEVTQNAPQTPVSIKTTGTKVVTVKPVNKLGQVPAGSSSKQSKASNGGGVQVGQQGCGTGAANCGGGSGTSVGNEGPAGPGAGPGPAPAPAPAPRPAPGPGPAPHETPTTPPREVITTPPPRETTPPPVITTPPPPKGTVPPCVSNPPYVIC